LARGFVSRPPEIFDLWMTQQFSRTFAGLLECRAQSAAIAADYPRPPGFVEY
jgi:hypothetical protein